MVLKVLVEVSRYAHVKTFYKQVKTDKTGKNR